MTKTFRVSVLIILLIILATLQISCGTTNKRFDVTNMSSLEPIKIARSIYVIIGHHTGLHSASSVSALFGIPGAIASTVISHQANKKDHNLTMDIISPNIPNLGELVIHKFADRTPKEISGWPSMEIDETAIWDYREYLATHFKSNSGSIIIFFFEDAQFSTINGLICDFKAVMWSSKDEYAWINVFKYRSTNFGPKRSLEEYRADNYKMLIQELEFATDKAVSAFISSLSKDMGIETVE